MSLTERALQQVLLVLQSNLNGALLDPVYAGTPNVQQFLFGAPDLRRASQMPLVAVDIDRQELQTRTMGGAAVSRRQKTIPALVYIYHAHRDEEQLLRQLIRLVDATVQTLEQAPQTPDYLFQSPRLVDLSPPVEGANQPFLRVAAISVQILVSHRQGESA